MPNSTPAIRAFNGGEFSALMEGRTDLDYYGSSLRNALNCILTPQGPIIGRSGTKFSCTAYTDDEVSVLVPFVYSEKDAQVLEFADDRIRFIDEAGIQIYAAQAFTLISTPGDPIEFTCATLNSVVGDQVVLSGYDPEYNLNGRIANITAKSVNDYTLDVSFPTLPAADGEAAKVYHIAVTYTEDQRKNMRLVQDVDLMYLLVEGVRPKKLFRADTYDWRLSNVEFVDGPYLDTNTTTTTLTPATTGNAIPVMTTNTLPSGTADGSSKRGSVAAAGSFLGRTIALGLAATDYFNAFDTDADETAQTYWAANDAQKAWVSYEFTGSVTVDGYSIHLALDNQDTAYSARDYAPRTWVFQGYNGSAWVTLDKQINYATWDNYKSDFFELAVPGSYAKYRLHVKQTLREGPLEVRIGRLIMRTTASASINFTASSITGINDDKGFLSTDIGRLLRVRGIDGYWRPLKITAVGSTTTITATLLGEPFSVAQASADWRLGLWSDTTGWPYTGEIYNERLYLGGSDRYPNVIAGSVVGAYEVFEPTTRSGLVLDDGAIVRYVKGRKAVKVQWITSDDKGLIVGTTGGEYAVFKPSNFPNYTPSGFDVRQSTERGCAAVDPIRVDNKVLYIQKNKRTLRQFQYTFERDTYASDNLSKFASHLGVPGYVEMDYAAEPHSLVPIRRGDNSVVILTYNPEDGEDILGWGRHDFAGAQVESLCVIPQEDQRQDMLWMETRREVNGSMKRYIEFMVRPWDFGDTIEDNAFFVDCGITYDGAEITDVYGLWHLEQQTVVGLADGKPIAPKQVIGGSITLDGPASKLVLGLGFETFAEVSALEGGTYEGTQQGKQQRVPAAAVAVWDTATGEIGRYDTDYNEWKWREIEFKEDRSEIEPVRLHTEITKLLDLPHGYDNKARIAIRRRADQPLPFNCVALYPRVTVADVG